MEGKAAVLGGTDFVMPYSMLGLDTFTVEPVADAVAEKAGEIVKGGYGLVVVAENVAEMAEVEFEEVHHKAAPCVIVVPFTQETDGVALKSLGKMLKLATGIDILQN